MSNVLILNQPFPSVGLPSYTFTVPAALPSYPFGGAGAYNVQVQANVTNSVIGVGAGSGLAQPPQVVSPSGISYVVAQNGTPIYISPAIASFQTSEQSKTDILCTVADVITVVFSSSTPIDEQLNTVKAIVTIGTGF